MRLGTRGRYAVIAMIDLAGKSNGKRIVLSEIAKEQKISLSYLEQIFSRISKAKLLDSSKGPGGGYKLSKSADQISVFSIIDAVDIEISARGCVSSKKCCGDSSCNAHQLWDSLDKAIESYLKSISLQDVLNNNLRDSFVE